jgi:hypothetical protein
LSDEVSDACVLRFQIGVGFLQFRRERIQGALVLRDFIREAGLVELQLRDLNLLHHDKLLIGRGDD